MAHTHHCQKCGIATAICNGPYCSQSSKDTLCAKRDCVDAKHGHHYCPVHHPDPEFHVEPTAPLKK